LDDDRLAVSVRLRMGEHPKYRKLTLTIRLLAFVIGGLIVAVFSYDLVYLSPGLLGSHSDGGFIGLGIVFMLAPFWEYLRKRRS
jgi:hypothetical protein